jgi:biopolymer transport protein ExbB
MERESGALIEQALEVWTSGGWAMIALAFNGLVIFTLGMTILLSLAFKGVYANPEVAWKKWRRAPHKARGPLSRIITAAMRSESIDDLADFFSAMRHEELAPFERDLRTMTVSVSAAPLLGLLGTVTGMLTTFRALATGGGGDKTMGMIASGISEALVTTETGLVIALSGMIFQFVLTRKHEKFDKMVAHIETQCWQLFQKEPGRLAA